MRTSDRGSSSDGRRYSSRQAQSPSSSKNVGPSIELVKGFAFSDFSGRTDNVFLSKMDVLRLFAIQLWPSELLP